MNHIKGLFGIIFAAVVVLAIGAPVALAQSGVPLPTLAKAYKGKQCIEPVEVMRREHMNFLTHQRDETVREGIRGNKYSLQQCIDCHATPDPNIQNGSVRTLEPFCGACHSYAAVNIDCFGCHNPTAPLETSKNSKNLPFDKMIAAHLGQGNPDTSRSNAGGTQ